MRALAVAYDVTSRLGKDLRLAGIDDGLFGTGEPFGADDRAYNITRYLSREADQDEAWWIIDEASQASTADWVRLMDRADQVGATIIAIGDPNQTGLGRAGRRVRSDRHRSSQRGRPRGR